MKINNIATQNVNRNQNFRGDFSKPASNFVQKASEKVTDATCNFLAKNSKKIAGLAGASVITQKIIMSGSEAVIGPCMDIAVGKTITKVTKETDNRTNDSSKTQAIRTFSQALGGTIVGVAVRALCIGASTALVLKNAFSNVVNVKDLNEYAKQTTAKAWGKSIGGAVAIVVMLATNFLLDVPLINKINEKVTNIVKKPQKQDAKEVK